VKGFELTLETAGNLLCKAIKDYVGNPRAVDELTDEDVFRRAAKHGLLEPAIIQRWFTCRAMSQSEEMPKFKSNFRP